MDLNLYKVDSDDMKELKKDLRNSGYKEVPLKEKFEKSKYFLYIEEKASKMLTWIEQLGNIFSDINIKKIRRDSVNAVLMIKIENYYLCLSFGQAFHKVDRYCDLNFGLDFAVRGIEDNGIKLKQSFYINSYKNKAIIDYTKENSDIREMGESIQLIQGKTATRKLGRKISCGSSVKFALSLRNENKIESLDKLNDFMKVVIETYKGTPKLEIPRVRYLKKKDKIIKFLDKKFQLEIIDESKLDDFELLLDSFYEKGGSVYFNFSDYEYKIKSGNRLVKKINSLIKDEILEIIRENFEQIHTLVLCVSKDSEFVFSMRLIDLFSYIYYDESDKKYYLLIHGRWVEFEEEFLEEINEGIEKIEFETNDNYNISDFDGEENYNKKISSEQKMILLDRKLYKGIEIGDLKTSENELIHVKKHKNFSELIYAIQQSILSTNLILNRNSHVSLEEKYGFPVRGEKFSQSLLFLFEKGYFYRNIHERQDVSKIRSIIFKLRLLSWHNFMKEKDMGHKVYLQYYEKSKIGEKND